MRGGFKATRAALHLVVVLVVTILVLAACGGASTAKSPSSNAAKGPITLWISGPEPTPGTLEGAANAFTAKTGIHVNVEETPAASYFQKQTTAIAAGTLPDVMVIGNTHAASFEQTGAFLSWTPSAFKTIGGRSQFVQTSMSATGVPGKAPVSVPFLAQTWVLLYNKDYFRQAGISGPPTTWTQFVADAEKLNDPATGRWGAAVPLGSPTDMGTWTWVMSRQYGGSFFKNGKAYLTQNQNATAITSFIKWLYPDQIVSPLVATDSTGTVAQTEFLDGKAAMSLTQNIQPVMRNPGKFGLGYVPLPSPVPAGGKRVMSHVAGQNLVIAKNTKHLAAAEEFVKFLVSTSEQVRINKGMFQLPVTHAALQASYFQTPAMKTFANILSKYARPTPVYPASSAVFVDVRNAVVSLVRTDVTNKNITRPQVASTLAGIQKTAEASGG